MMKLIIAPILLLILFVSSYSQVRLIGKITKEVIEQSLPELIGIRTVKILTAKQINSIVSKFPSYLNTAEKIINY